MLHVVHSTGCLTSLHIFCSVVQEAGLPARSIAARLLQIQSEVEADYREQYWVRVIYQLSRSLLVSSFTGTRCILFGRLGHTVYCVAELDVCF